MSAADDPRLPTLAGGELEPYFVARAEGAAYREALEALLLTLPLERAELLMQRLREGRAAWLPLVTGAARTALLVGDALSGTALALGRTPLALTVVDRDVRRLAHATDRDDALAGGRTTFIEHDARRGLPFADGAFDLVIDERGAPTAPELAELARVAGGELVCLCDNRLAYKLSTGVRADFRRVGPLQLAARALRPPHGERTLVGWRRALGRAGLARTEALALYPHRFDFSHVVALDAPGPRLTVGPKERANPAKVAGQALGLFPWFTPSFALRAARGPLTRPWVEGLLETVAGAVGSPTPILEHLVATRGNTGVLLTRGPAWCLHLPLSPAQERQSRRHFEALGLLERRFPAFPAPRPVWEGEVDGRYACAETRLGGLSAPQLTGRLEAAARTYRDLAEALAGLVTEPAARADEREVERLVGAKLAAAGPRTGRASTRAALEHLADGLGEALARWSVPRVLYHADLRAKHVQVEPDGRVVGLMDFGSFERADLPLFDLLNLVLHDRKQRTPGWTIGDAWRLALDGGLADFERAALDRHARALDLPEGYVGALVRAFPLLVGAMAESNWDYSRPRWIHRSFDL